MQRGLGKKREKKEGEKKRKREKERNMKVNDLIQKLQVAQVLLVNLELISLTFQG